VVLGTALDVAGAVLGIVLGAEMELHLRLEGQH
jgi:hypothetical protein